MWHDSQACLSGPTGIQSTNNQNKLAGKSLTLNRINPLNPKIKI